MTTIRANKMAKDYMVIVYQLKSKVESSKKATLCSWLQSKEMWSSEQLNRMESRCSMFTPAKFAKLPFSCHMTSTIPSLALVRSSAIKIIPSMQCVNLGLEYKLTKSAHLF